MIHSLSRRQIFGLASCTFMLAPARTVAMAFGFSGFRSAAQTFTSITDSFPTQPPELAREMVTVSHFSLKRVKELVEAQPSLARAAWDWGFGDWEDALGAASHTGHDDIAQYLIASGARPTLFSAAMLGQLEVVKTHLSACPNAIHIRGPHSITLLAHAKAGGERAQEVAKFLSLSVGIETTEALVPLSPEELATIVGSYPIGIGPNEFVDVSVEENRFLDTKELIWTRRGTTGRPLYHLGNKVFYPAGSRAVRISFQSSEERVAMSVQDSKMLFTVSRS